MLSQARQIERNLKLIRRDELQVLGSVRIYMGQPAVVLCSICNFQVQLEVLASLERTNFPELGRDTESTRMSGEAG